MSKSTEPITYVYEVEGREVEITRAHVGSAYPSNGNVGNATEYFTWSARCGLGVTTGASSRASAYEHARAMILGHRYYDHPNFPTRWVGVRNFREVAAEMKANYRGRRKLVDAAS